MDNKIGTRWNIWEEMGHDIKINASGIFEKKSARDINKAWDLYGRMILVKTGFKCL